ncbi:ubiquitin carboxyl-terminal hydrolase CYLD isoform X3 [Stegostoma tigrinum]|uniref:ubiquitin carboxyl-terminal hydrolase CYLD isoform X3 n=1 Tax=Stegostoma tigrinum TaxID=3053191 RepID=UPI00202ADC4F|nr:ubiquitin carboxyl-terminal hydrolase CYLD isoform X3 [Stegostoma tigrinum]
MMPLSSKKETKYRYFILMEDLSIQNRVFPAGNIAIVAEADFLQSEAQGPSRRMKFHLVEAEVYPILELASLRELSEQEARFLQAVSPSAQRLDLYLEEATLAKAQLLQISDPVIVDYKSQSLPGVVAYIGNICDSPKLSGTFFGIKLQRQVELEEDGKNDGTFNKKQYFQCERGHGIFVPFHKVRRCWSIEEAGKCIGVGDGKMEDPLRDRPVSTGDRVAVYLEEGMERGLVIDVINEDSTVMVNFKPDQAKGEELKMCVKVPLSSVIREDLLRPAGSMYPSAWNRESHVVPVVIPPPRNGEAVRVLEGRMRGIQGHCNSCYMDTALFSLFSCTLVLDSMLHKATNPQCRHIQRILREEIVNPLRRDGFVDCKKVMNLRRELTAGGSCAGFTSEEKDPEEFLNVIMQHVLGLEPLLKLRSAGHKDQECYCHQIFIDQDDDLTVPTVQQLVEHSFHSNQLKLAEVPSCLIVQMPRFGKNYKMFEKIIPSLELDITDLLWDSPRECCVCGELATQECEECFKDKLFSKTGLKQFCDVCWRQVHSHSSRCSHRSMKLKCPEEFVHSRKSQVPREKMQLFAVLCIETSHYVSFIKYGLEDHHWMFFDSMSDRHGGESGYNIPTVTLCPEVAKYAKRSAAQLVKDHPRDMEGVAKRQLCDAYMYLYEHPRMAVYK